MEIRKTCLVTLVVYKEHLENFEKLSLHRMFRVLHNYDITLICPEDLDMTEYDEIARAENYPNYIRWTFDKDYFTSKHSYNLLMVNYNFWYGVRNYDYIFNYQLDCYIFKDDLQKWMNESYDQVECICFDFKGDEFFNGQGLRKVRAFYDFIFDKNNTDVISNFVATHLAVINTKKNGLFKKEFAENYIFVDGEDYFFFKFISKMHIPKICFKFGWSVDKEENWSRYGCPTLIHYFQDPREKEFMMSKVGDWENDLEGCLNRNFCED